MSRVRRIALLVGVTTLVLAAPASGAVTIGSNLTNSANGTACGAPLPPSSGSCTLANSALALANQAPGGLTAPSSGVIVRWRIKTSGARAFDARPRVLAGAALAASGTTVPIPAAAATVTTDARLTVHTGETFGVV